MRQDRQGVSISDMHSGGESPLWIVMAGTIRLSLDLKNADDEIPEATYRKQSCRWRLRRIKASISFSRNTGSLFFNEMLGFVS